MADTSHYARCRAYLDKFKRTHKIRLITLLIVIAVNFFFHVLTFTVKYAGPSLYGVGALEQPLSMLPYGMGVATLICSLIAIALGIFAEPKRPYLVFILMGLVLICTFADFFHWINTAIILIAYATEIKEILNYRWLKEQPGFPHFSERFEEQTRYSEYQPMHKLDGRSEAQMADAEGGDPVQQSSSGQSVRKTVAAPAASYTMQMGNTPDEMPGISEIFEESSETHPESEILPEPELPKVSDIPEPEWNVSDPVLGTKVVISKTTSEEILDQREIPEIPRSFQPHKKTVKIDTSHYDKCRILMKKLEQKKARRFYALVFMAAVNIMMRFLLILESGSQSGILTNGIYLIAAVLFAALQLPLGASAPPEKPKMIGILMGVTVLAFVLGIYNNIFMIAVMILYGLSFLETWDAKWLMEQPGYPYFSERFEEQKQKNNEYVPPHALDGKYYADMTDAEGNAAPETATPPRMPEPVLSGYTLQSGNTPEEMLGISEILETQEASLQSASHGEQVLLNKETTEPDPNPPVPDMDTGIILSTVPDIASDIPELPEIPDIPKL